MKAILDQTAHRPFPLPGGKWRYYQEWNNALFLHWAVPYAILRKVVPETLNIDTFKGKAYVSIVAFTMQHIRPRYLPAIRAVSDFHEINLRTYIHNDGKPGVYFLSIEAGKALSAHIAKTLSGLPYEKAEMQRRTGKYQSLNPAKNFVLKTRYDIGARNLSKSALDRWLTERYCLYLHQNTRNYRYDIHHLEWEINNVKLKQLDVNYTIGDLQLTGSPDLCHYSKGVQVLAWPRQLLEQ